MLLSQVLSENGSDFETNMLQLVDRLSLCWQKLTQNVFEATLEDQGQKVFSE